MGKHTNAIKLHLGCGPRHIDGFVHVDVRPFDHVDHVSAVEALDHFADCSVDLIYASHVLEHFGRHVYMSVLREWFRVLRPGGILRLSVPDFAKTVQVYQLEQNANRGMAPHWGALVGGQRDPWDFHNSVFDQVTLGTSLRAVGFADSRLWDWRKTEHAHVDDYSQAHWPHMDKENGILMSLNMEGIK